MSIDTISDGRCIRAAPATLVYTALPVMAATVNAAGRGPSADGRTRKVRSGTDVRPGGLYRLLCSAPRATSV